MSKEEVLRKNIGLIPFATMDAGQGKCILEAMDEWAVIVSDKFGQSLDYHVNRNKVLTIVYDESIYNFIKASASMREIDGIEYYNVFGNWQQIKMMNNPKP